MSLGGTYRIVGRSGWQGRKTLALLGALVLALGAHIFIGGEAWAQQLPREEAQPQSVAVAEAVVNERTVEIDGEVVEPVAPPAEDIPPDETPASLPVEAVPQQVVRDEPVTSPEPAPPGPDLADTNNVVSGPAPVEPEAAPPVPEPEPVLPVEPAPPVETLSEPAAFEENEPLPAPVAPAVTSYEEEYWPPSDLESTVSSAVETLQGAANALGDVADRSLLRPATGDEGLVGTALVVLSSEVVSDSTPESAENSESPSGGSGDPSRNAPQPSSPFALPPVGGGAFHLTGSEVGSGGVHLLLLCVLVYGLVLSRREGRLSWGFWEPPKPSSALLLPLERPG